MAVRMRSKLILRVYEGLKAMDERLCGGIIAVTGDNGLFNLAVTTH